MTAEMPSDDSTPTKTVSIERLTFPIGTTLALVGVLIGGIVSVAGVWYKATSHAEDVSRHLDQHRTLSEGGAAYQHTMERSLEAQYARTRKLIRTLALHCTKQGEGFGCRVELPDVE